MYFSLRLNVFLFISRAGTSFRFDQSIQWFIALLESIRVATTTLNYDVVKSVVAERKAQFKPGILIAISPAGGDLEIASYHLRKISIS